MLTSKEAIKALAREAAMLPQEEMLEVSRKKSSLFIGIPRETTFQEHRVALVPEAVNLLVSNGARVIVESNAGRASRFGDRDYSEAGAEIAMDRAEVFKADIILKVAPPTDEEIAMMQHRQTLFSALQLSVQPKDTLKKLMSKKVSAIAWDFIKDETGIYPIVKAMGEIAGNTSMLIAAEYLSNINDGNGLMLGGISGVAPSEVVIIGAGTAGEFAARAALGLGASVKIFDPTIYRLRRLQNDLGTRLFTSVLQPKELEKALINADVVVGALRGRDGRTPCVVTEDMVRKMKNGSVIIDISIDQGGCFETSSVTTHTNPVFKAHGVVHYCVPNIASRVSRTASKALSNIFAPLLLAIAEEGGVANLIKCDEGFRHGVYIYNGTLTNDILGQAFNLPYKDIDLLFAAM
jgi:alanine dehydrogenase